MVPALLRRPGPALLLLALLAVVLLLEPSSQGVRLLGHRIPELCPAALAGGSCPGCGTGRAILLALHGRVAAAWALQPAAFLLLLLLPVGLLARHLASARLARLQLFLALLWAAAALLLWSAHVAR